jgi:UDPglucose--hexose-1-phosphate uridylyltransferase
VLVSPQRTERPWQGRLDEPRQRLLPSYDPQCYLCPGTLRANGERNPAYASVHVFTNDFAALIPGSGSQPSNCSALLQAVPHAGTCRVICYSPAHDRTLADLSESDIIGVVDCWARETEVLAERWRWVQIFENRGELMGCSNPHPHGQIWAGDFIPNEPAREFLTQERWAKKCGSPLLIDYLRLERNQRERIVVESDEWIVVVPWWATWPFETLLMPTRHVRRLPDISGTERVSLARVLSILLRAYDALFAAPMPYSFGWHGVPEGPDADMRLSYSGAQLHAHFYPPLLRSASIRKFMVGYEMLAEPQRDMTPEEAASRLRAAAESVSFG